MKILLNKQKSSKENTRILISNVEFCDICVKSEHVKLKFTLNINRTN